MRKRSIDLADCAIRRIFAVVCGRYGERDAGENSRADDVSPAGRNRVLRDVRDLNFLDLQGCLRHMRSSTYVQQYVAFRR